MLRGENMATKTGRNPDLSNLNVSNPSGDRLLNIENICLELKKGQVNLERGQERLDTRLVGIEGALNQLQDSVDDLKKGQAETNARLDGMAGDISEIKELLKKRE